ncbi:DNA modification methyltransferase, partial [mine drainage metagenome]
TLRAASAAATGWPYIAPTKHIQEKDGIDTFAKHIDLCLRDLSGTPEEFRGTPAEIVEADCRRSPFGSESFDFAFTSPPYLNNYDYGDRTRLESYFTQFVKTWSDITEKVRDHLIVSATTQISRTDYETRDILSDDLKQAEPKLAKELQGKVDLLSQRRLVKGGKKSYDIMVGQYFNDMTLSIADTFRLLKPRSKHVLILGDSAPVRHST